MDPTQEIPVSDLFFWKVTNNITAAGTPADQNFKTPGFDLKIIKVTGSLFNPSGAINESLQARDRILFQMVSGDTQAQLANQAMDIFAFLNLWKDSTSVPRLLLSRNTNYQCVFSIDTTTSLGTYPLRIELDFVGVKVTQ